MKNIIHILRKRQLSTFCETHQSFHMGNYTMTKYCKWITYNRGYCDMATESVMAPLPVDVDFLRRHHFDICELCVKRIGLVEVYG